MDLPSNKRFRSVAHNLGHHASSFLSYLHPHLSEACRLAGLAEVTIDLRALDLYPPGLPRLRPLELALGGLRSWFVAQLLHKGLTEHDVTSATLLFTFRPDKDEWFSGVRSTVTRSPGLSFSYEFDVGGRRMLL
jgi:hypothetical protein